MAFYYRVSKSLLPNLNGDYCPNEDSSSFKIADKDLILVRGVDGLWKFTDSKVVAYATKPSESPTEQTPWIFFSTMGSTFPLSLKIERCDGSPRTSHRQGTAAHKKIEESRRYIDESHDLVRNKAGGSVTPNVGEHSFTCEESTLQVYFPLGDYGEAEGEVHKTLHAAVWADSVDFWSQSLILSSVLAVPQGKLQSLLQSTLDMREEILFRTEELSRRLCEFQLVKEDGENTEKISQTIVESLGKVHVQRDAAAEEGAAFPSGEEIKIKYLSVFGDSFEPASSDVISFIEEIFQVKDGMNIFVREVVAPLFTVAHAYALEAIQAKYRKLAEVFGLPWEQEEEEEEDDNVVRLFFLASQQQPMIAAASAINESTALKICRAMGPRAEAVRTQMPAWAAQYGVMLNFDLLEMVRVLVWVNTAIELSDPKCYLYPRIGFAHHHVANKDIYKEVFSPGTKKFGFLASGDEVEVVLPGLYFEAPIDIAPPGAQGEAAQIERAVAVPVVPVRVRRLLADNLKEISLQRSVELEEQLLSMKLGRKEVFEGRDQEHTSSASQLLPAPAAVPQDGPFPPAPALEREEEWINDPVLYSEADFDTHVSAVDALNRAPVVAEHEQEWINDPVLYVDDA